MSVAGDRLNVYVDGFNLYHGLHDRSGHKDLWLDLAALSRALRPNSSLEHVKYFTAPVLNQPGAASRQARYQQALTAFNPGVVEIIQGRYQTKEIRCDGCGHKRKSYEEKETDVNIATSLVADALLDRFDSALVISADSDLIPAVKSVLANAPTKFVAAAFPPKRFSADLKQLMPSSFHIGYSKIKQAQLPAVVTHAQTGRQYARPAKWS